ncbi:MAG TPA: SRPBCC family protein [Polyangium sp.]|nr:SRPBCC family protein [Polyangium sp.]
MERERTSLFARRALALLGGAALVGTTLLGPEAAAGGSAPPDIRVVEVKGSDTPKVVAKAVIDQPPEKVWQVVSECASYKKRMPRIEASKLVKQDGNKHTCEVTIAMPFPLSNLTAVTEAVHEVNDKGMSRRWKLLRGDYKFNEGSWEVKPHDGGKKSLLVYTVHAEPNTALPGWIREAAQKKAIPELFERVGNEAAKLK